MKQIIMLDNGTKLEIDGDNVKHIAADGIILYDTAVSSIENTEAAIRRYFFLIGASEREKVENWIETVVPETVEQETFFKRVRKALEEIAYDYKIAILEPSFDQNGKIFYKEGNEVARGIKFGEWKEKAEEFYSDGKWYSDMAWLEEGDLFKAYRIAMGYWSIKYVCDDSSSDGNYQNAPNATHNVEVSGAKKVGGFCDGVGNAYEIYQTESGFALVGGCYHNFGNYCPVADTFYIKKANILSYDGFGVLVLRRTVH